jgi:hypothetical protein
MPLLDKEGKGVVENRTKEIVYNKKEYMNI